MRSEACVRTVLLKVLEDIGAIKSKCSNLMMPLGTLYAELDSYSQSTPKTRTRKLRSETRGRGARESERHARMGTCVLMDLGKWDYINKQSFHIACHRFGHFACGRLEHIHKNGFKNSSA